MEKYFPDETTDYFAIGDDHDGELQKNSILQFVHWRQPPPAITAVGIPNGPLVTKTIGVSGGSIISGDGKMELTFPANALSANTDISIQPVTNETPGGIGASYQLLPEGTKFNNPVSLTFHYTSDDINGTLPYLLYIAFQDSSLTWQADLKNRNVDTIAETVTLGIQHFSVWTLGALLNMHATPDELQQNQTSSVSVTIRTNPEKPVDAGDDDIL